MKNLFKKFTKKTALYSLAVAALIGISGTIAVAEFGPNRPTREWTVQENGFDYVTFNSFTGVPNGIGDERDFLRGSVVGSGSNWQDPVTEIVNEDVVEAKIYIHNNADPLLNDAPGNPGIARNVTVRVDIPGETMVSQEVKAYIAATNAQPTEIFDSLDLSGVNGSLMSLGYVPGSAKLGNQTLSDAIFTTGVQLDDQKGCFEFIREITFKIKVTKPGYQVQKTARLKGEDSTKWRKVVNAKRGDHIEWRISFQNIGSTQLDSVKVVDDLPSYTDIVDGSVKLYNTGYPSGQAYGPEAIQNNGDMVNVDIGSYAAASNAFLLLETVIEDNEAIQCGIHQLTNVAYVTPNGLGTLNDNASVNIINDEECEEPVEPVYACVSLNSVLVSTNKYRFTTAGNAENGAEIVGYGFDFDDGTEIVQTTENSVEHTFTPGDYTVRSAVYVSVNGEIVATDDNAACTTNITVEEAEEPVYACEQFLLVASGKKVTASFRPVSANGATFKDASFEFKADGLVKNSIITNNIASNGIVSAEYTFDNNAKEAVVNVTVNFNVGSEVKSVTCSGNLSFTTPKCEVPGKEHLPKDSPLCVKTPKTPTTPTTLPNTGAGEMVSLMAVVTLAGAVAHRVFTLKRQ